MQAIKVWQPNSLVFSAGLAMAIITSLALVGTGFSIIIAHWADGDAKAINEAGSMRMQTYRIANRLAMESEKFASNQSAAELREFLVHEVRLFNRKLFSKNIRDLSTPAQGKAVSNAYQQVVNSWQRKMQLPISVLITPNYTFNQYIDAIAAYQHEVDNFARQIDNLVLNIQHNSEYKIHWIRVGEGVTLLLTIAVAFVIVYLIHTNMVVPLRDLVTGAHRAGAGDFNYRTRYQGKNELGLLCSTYNSMAANMAKQYHHLEALVNEKTLELQQSNLTLAHLYNTSRRLFDNSYSREVIEEVLDELVKLAELKHVSLCLFSSPGMGNFELIEPASSQPEPRCSPFRCAICVSKPEINEISISEKELILPIQEQGEQFGYIYLICDDDNPFSHTVTQLIESTVDIISMTILLHQKSIQEKRLALMEERAVIARELHDSLAQSLSYMKIQVAWLRTQMKRAQPVDQLTDGVNNLHEALNGAYRQLRELLTTFRLKLGKPTLHAALLGTVAEFEERSEIPISMEYGPFHCELTPNEDIHILQIVREALSNATKHSQASQITVHCRSLGDDIQVSIKDNGIGVSTQTKTHHYGMAIMEERTRSLSGTIKVNNCESGGVEVVLRFTPQLHKSVVQYAGNLT